LILVNASDFSEPTWGLEIKWSNRYVEKLSELRILFAFCEINHLSAALVTSIDKQTQLSERGIELNFYPASLYAYVVGANTLKIKDG
jgi:hypothetical protein